MEDNNWRNVEKELPKYDKAVKYFGKNGTQGYAYLSMRTKTFKCLMTSEDIKTQVTQWRYEN